MSSRLVISTSSMVLGLGSIRKARIGLSPSCRFGRLRLRFALTLQKLHARHNIRTPKSRLPLAASVDHDIIDEGLASTCDDIDLDLLADRRSAGRCGLARP
jgi:hypothetical protein